MHDAKHTTRLLFWIDLQGYIAGDRWKVTHSGSLHFVHKFKEKLGVKLTVEDLQHIVEAVVLSIPELNDRVRIDAPGQACLVNVDKAKITQALSNLLDNALKFSPPDESVTISMRLTADEKLPRISVAIEDRGIGMSAEQMVRFGERFWRADPSGVIPGTGLGVSLVKEIIQLHGGSLEVSSEFGKGSCITFYLPLVVHGEAALAALVQGE